ncbi:MAG: peptide-binding protein [Candidatus Wallbacteria bacterium]|nr:peptide-binding protein [Candidatus Wallbacteria bacterium]
MFRYLIINLILTGLFITGCGGNERSGQNEQVVILEHKPEVATLSYGDTYVESYIADIISLNPVLINDGVSYDICEMVFSGLVKMDENYSIVPDMAETWEVSADGMSISFRLRKGIQWHDGAPFTAEDVRFTFDKIVDPAIECPDRDYYESFETIEVRDNLNLKVVLREPFAPALEYCGFSVIPAHLYRGVDISTSPNNQRPVGTGPFRFISWTPDEQVVLEAFPEYYNGRAYIDRYVYRVIPDKSMAFLAFQKGEIDLFTLTNDQLKLVSESSEFKTRFNLFRTSKYLNYLCFNLEKPYLADAKVRLALVMGIDRQEIIDRIKQGNAVVTTGPFMPGHWSFNESTVPIPYDPEQARILLEEAGYRDKDGDGIREKNGQKLAVEFLNTGNYAETLLVPRALQSYWREIGVECVITALEWSKVLDRTTKKDFDVTIFGQSLGGWDPHSEFGNWHSTQVPTEENNWRGYNLSSYRNPEVDRLLEQGRSTYDFEERKLIYRRIHEILNTDQPCCFLYVLQSVHAIDKRFHGVALSNAGRFTSLTKWYVPEHLQKYR